MSERRRNDNKMQISCKTLGCPAAVAKTELNRGDVVQKTLVPRALCCYCRGCCCSLRGSFPKSRSVKKKKVHQLSKGKRIPILRFISSVEIDEGGDDQSEKIVVELVVESKDPQFPLLLLLLLLLLVRSIVIHLIQ